MKHFVSFIKVILGISNILLSKKANWQLMQKNERSKMATILFDLIDKMLFDDYIENFVNSELYSLDQNNLDYSIKSDFISKFSKFFNLIYLFSIFKLII